MMRRPRIARHEKSRMLSSPSHENRMQTMASRREILRAACVSTLLGLGGRSTAVGARITGGMKIIIPYSPGGSTDMLTRIVAQGLGERWGQAVSVDYKPGAGSMIGVAYVAQAPADGSTIGVVNSSFVINPLLRKSVPYRMRDLRPVTQLTEVPIVLAANPATPYDTLPQLIEHARRSGQPIAFAMPGMGGAAHLAGELLGRVAGFRMMPLAYKGSPSAHADVIGGHVPLLIEPLMSVLPQVQAKRMKIIAVLSYGRVKGAEQYPAASEALPEFGIVSFFGLVAPAATPEAAIDEIAAGVAAVFGKPEDRERIEGLGMFPRALGPEAFRQLLEKEEAKWGTIIREQNIVVE